MRSMTWRLDSYVLEHMNLRKQMAAKNTVARDKPQSADEEARLEEFIAAHPELLRAYDEEPAPEHRRRWMLRQMRLRAAFERQRNTVVQALEHFPDLKQRLVARKSSGLRQKPGEMSPKVSP